MVLFLVTAIVTGGCLGPGDGAAGPEPTVNETDDAATSQTGSTDGSAAENGASAGAEQAQGSNVPQSGDEAGDRRADRDSTDDGRDSAYGVGGTDEESTAELNRRVSSEPTLGFLPYRREDPVRVLGYAVAGVYAGNVDGEGAEELLAVGGEAPTLFREVDGAYRPVRRFQLDNEVGGALFFDYDNDGLDELYLLNHLSDPSSPSVFFDNDGGTLQRSTVGLEERFAGAHGATAGDFDGDGCADVLVYQAGDWQETRPAGYGEIIPVALDNGRPNVLFRGDCEEFTRHDHQPVASTWTLAASFADFTGDGFPDIHAANDFNEDLLYRNDGDGTFTRTGLGRATDRNGMSSTVADVNDDGHLDIFVSNIFVENQEYRRIFARRLGNRIGGNNLLINEGNGSFTDRAEEWGVRRSGWGWAAIAEDFDSDGHQDIYQASTSIYVDNASENQFWRGRGDGFVRERHPGLSIDVESLGLATLHGPDDGPPAVAISNLGGRYLLYRPDQGDDRWIQIDVRSGDEGTALGTTVTVEVAGERRTRVTNARTGYQSQSSRIHHVGLGEARTADVVVTFPDGTERRFADVSAGQRLTVRRD